MSDPTPLKLLTEVHTEWCSVLSCWVHRVYTEAGYVFWYSSYIPLQIDWRGNSVSSGGDEQS